jgi:Ca2+-binding RTX toxin-like protein
MAVFQAFSPFGFNMDVGNPLQINYDIDPVITSSSITFATFSGGTMALGGSGFSAGSLSGTLTSMVQTSDGVNATFSLTGLNMSLETAAALTDDDNPNFGPGFFANALSGDDTVIGADGQSDILRGFSGADQIQGLGGNDLIYGNQSNDILLGGGGFDTIFGGQQSDAISGGAEDDIIYGNFDQDTIFGEDGNDTIFGGQSDDSLVGGAGDDLIFANRGNDVLTGGEGADVFQFSFASAAGINRVTDFNASDDALVINNTAGTGTAVFYDAGANETVIRTSILYDQGQFLPGGVFESAGSTENYVILSGGDFTSTVGVSIFLN